MSTREFIVLGTASQAPTRHRAHNSYVLRWDDQLILFDPGEGTQRQAIFAGVSIARLTAICITHFHGDHCLGLPGIIQRRALDSRSRESPLPDLPAFFPAEGQEFFDRLQKASIFHDSSAVHPNPVHSDGILGEVGGLQLSARSLNHRVSTMGYRVDEPPQTRLDKEKLQTRGITGRAVGQLAREGCITTSHGKTSLSEVSATRPGQSMAFVMDTALCDGAAKLADGVDLLVCESTFAHSEKDLAQKYMHLTARQAGQLAKEAGAKRLVLTHFSARYSDTEQLGNEAAEFHNDVVVAKELDHIALPSRS